MRQMNKWLWSLGLASLVAVPLIAGTQTEQLPISAFYDAQDSSYFMTWTTQVDVSPYKWVNFDLLGLRAAFFGVNVGTTFDGGVSVRPLADGRAHVTVRIHTKNAICWGYHREGSANIPEFGYTPMNVSGGAPASLGDGLHVFEFTMPSPDAPLPSIRVLFSGSEDYPLESIVTTINCQGALRAGSGYPPGTPGAAHVTQVGRFTIGFPGHCPTEDCWPAEVVKMWATGPR